MITPEKFADYLQNMSASDILKKLDYMIKALEEERGEHHVICGQR